MGLLAGIHYDPAAAVSKATTSNLAMTAFDTTNLRVTFIAPFNGAVLVRVRCTLTGATSIPQILLGALDGATVRARIAPLGYLRGGTAVTRQLSFEGQAVVSGLTPGTSYTWDAAYGVEDAVAATNIKYGGPNDTTTNNAWGGIVFEVWETPNLLGAILYDPAVAATKVTTSLLAMTAFDTTNLRQTFVCPGSGNVFVRLRVLTTKANTTQADIFLGILDGATVRGRQSPMANHVDTSGVANRQGNEASFVVTGLTPGTSYTWDAAYAVEIVATGGTPIIGYGGPNDTTSDNAYGAFGYEIYDASPQPFVPNGPTIFF